MTLHEQATALYRRINRLTPDEPLRVADWQKIHMIEQELCETMIERELLQALKDIHLAGLEFWLSCVVHDRPYQDQLKSFSVTLDQIHTLIDKYDQSYSKPAAGDNSV